jgi:hypothetical protein
VFQEDDKLGKSPSDPTHSVRMVNADLVGGEARNTDIGNPIIIISRRDAPDLSRIPRIKLTAAADQGLTWGIDDARPHRDNNDFYCTACRLRTDAAGL